MPRKRQGFLKRHVIALLGTPDRYWGWYLPAVRAGLRLLRQERIVAMVSSGPPWISHLVARRLKLGNLGVRWLADFRDPWAQALVPEEFPGWRKAINRRLEASIVSTADLVISNTDRLSKSFRVSYPALPAEHFFTLTNGFDDAPVSVQRRFRRTVAVSPCTLAISTTAAASTRSVERSRDYGNRIDSIRRGE